MVSTNEYSDYLHLSMYNLLNVNSTDFIIHTITCITDLCVLGEKKKKILNNYKTVDFLFAGTKHIA